MFIYLKTRRRNPVPTSVDEEQLKSQLLEVKKTQQLFRGLAFSCDGFGPNDCSTDFTRCFKKV